MDARPKRSSRRRASAETSRRAPVIASPASAQTKQDGLVNVNVGDVTILEDVNIAAAVDAVAVLCPAVSVSDIAILARQTDTTSRTTTVCRTEDNDKVRFTQN